MDLINRPWKKKTKKRGQGVNGDKGLFQRAVLHILSYYAVLGDFGSSGQCWIWMSTVLEFDEYRLQNQWERLYEVFGNQDNICSNPGLQNVTEFWKNIKERFRYWHERFKVSTTCRSTWHVFQHFHRKPSLRTQVWFHQSFFPKISTYETLFSMVIF